MLNVVFAALTLVAIAIVLGTVWHAASKANVVSGEWVTVDQDPERSPERLLGAIENARMSGDFAAVEQLTEALKSLHEPKRDERLFDDRERIEIALAIMLAAMLMLIPMIINYVVFGAFRAWNTNEKMTND